MTSDVGAAIHPGAADPDALERPESPPPSTLYDVTIAHSRLGVVLAAVGAGLLVVGLADALARTGHETAVIPLFCVGVLGVFLPCAWRLATPSAPRGERLAVSVVLGVALLLAFYLRSPLIFNSFDELLHGTTLHALVTQRSLGVHNTLVPVSPYYPALELFTIGTMWLTGLPLVLAQLAVLLVVRVVLILGLFLVVERVCRSSLAAGLGVLVFASNPQFFAFDSQYSYETLALALAVAAMWFLFSSMDAATAQRPLAVDGSDPSSSPADRRMAVRARRYQLLAWACIVALVFTHHLTSWLTSLVLVVWYLTYRLSGLRPRARIVGRAALLAVVLCTGWTAFVGGHLLTYLGPIFRAAIIGFGSAIGQLHSSRQLFTTPTGKGGATTWEIAAMLAAAGLWCLVLGAVLSDTRRTWVRHRGLLAWAPLVVAAGYPVALATSLASGSTDVGQRATTFIFFGMAVCVGGWVATNLTSTTPALTRGLVTVVASICFLGSLLFGSGPAVTLVPGPYQVGADTLSMGAPSTAMARWASDHLPPGSHVAADRDNGVLLGELSRVTVVTAIGGLVNPGPLFFDPQLTSFDLKLIRQGQIRYIVTDLRLASSLPLFGTYIEPGESKPGQRLTRAELTKYESVPGV
ncbi:MAG TPA: hypothetical protein VKR22_05200, partial [Acidimicrobiales bacterium]|nr:hypothetical protein [Acidimicrobiales bacterium]